MTVIVNMCDQNTVLLEEKIEALGEQKEELESEIENVRTYLQTFHYAVSTLMAVSFSDRQLVYDTVLGLACNFVDGNKGTLLLSENDDGALSPAAVKNMSVDMLCKFAVPGKDSLLSPVIKNKKLMPLDNDSCLALPLVFENEVMGVIVIAEKGGGTRKFSDDDIRFLTAFSTMAASTINNAKLLEDIKGKERLEQELKIARQIQTALLPKIPVIPGLEIAARMAPAEEVGGDFYDFVRDKDGRNWFAVGDVSSHGVTPGLIMMMCQSIFGTILTQNGKNLLPSDVIEGINRVLYENIRERLLNDDYMTLVVLAYDGQNKFTFAGAHEDMLVYRAGTGQCEVIPTSGIWVGMVKELFTKTENSSFILENGDVLVIYTDGLIQGRNEDGEQFDQKRLRRCLEANARLSAEEIKNRMWKEISNWMFCQDDDVTIVVVKKV